MLRQVSVQIPKELWPDIDSFLSTSVADLEQITAWLKTTTPRPDVEDLAEECSEFTGVPADVIESVFSVAINVSGVTRASGQTLLEALDAISNNLEKSGFSNWQEQQSQAWAEREPILTKLLHIDSVIEVMAKARELLYDFQSLLYNTNVLTDVRNVFSSDASAVVGGIITHTLSLDYFEERRYRNLHITITKSDAEKLIKQLQRALSKAESTKQMLDNNHILELTPNRTA